MDNGFRKYWNSKQHTEVGQVGRQCLYHPYFHGVMAASIIYDYVNPISGINKVDVPPSKNQALC